MVMLNVDVYIFTNIHLVNIYIYMYWVNIYMYIENLGMNQYIGIELETWISTI